MRMRFVRWYRGSRAVPGELLYRSKARFESMPDAAWESGLVIFWC